MIHCPDCNKLYINSICTVEGHNSKRFIMANFSEGDTFWKNLLHEYCDDEIGFSVDLNDLSPIQIVEINNIIRGNQIWEIKISGK